MRVRAALAVLIWEIVVVISAMSASMRSVVADTGNLIIAVATVKWLPTHGRFIWRLVFHRPGLNCMSEIDTNLNHSPTDFHPLSKRGSG